MKIVRQCSFESNSSSSHSLLIRKPGMMCYNHIKAESYDRLVHIEFGEFGWGIDTYYGAMTKLSYAVTMVAETEKFNSEDEFYETAGMKAINELIRDKCHCNGVCVDYPNFQQESYTWNGEIKHYMSHNGYIDHQSCEYYDSLQDFLDDWDITLERFIFDDNVGLLIDNDNH